MCWGKAEEFTAWKGRVADEEIREKEREIKVSWREPADEVEEAPEREEAVERV